MTPRTTPRARGEEALELSVLGVVRGERIVVQTRSPTLVVTLESSAIEVTCRGTETNVDRSGCFVAPADGYVALRGQHR